MLEKTRTVLNRPDPRVEHAGDSVSFVSDHEDGEVPWRHTGMSLDKSVWHDMGKPDVITITIEPGDKLNG